MTTHVRWVTGLQEMKTAAQQFAGWAFSEDERLVTEGHRGELLAGWRGVVHRVLAVTGHMAFVSLALLAMDDRLRCCYRVGRGWHRTRRARSSLAGAGRQWWRLHPTWLGVVKLLLGLGSIFFSSQCGGGRLVLWEPA